MAITSYRNSKTGETLWRVRVTKTLPEKPGLRADKTVTSIKSEIEALRVEARLALECERELYLTEPKKLKWVDLVDEWELTARKGNIFIREVARSTVEDYVSTLRYHTAHWMKMKVEEIDRATAWMTLDQCEREGSIGRRKKLRSAIDAVYKWAILSGRLKGINSIPTEGFKTLRKEEEKMPEILNLEQIRTLLRYAKELDHPWFPIWALALFTGMRSGELYALEWEQVDFENGLLYVHKNWTSKNGYGPTKGRYWRAVPIESGQVLTLLKELRLKRANEKYVLNHWHSWTDGGQAAILREFCVGAGLPSIRFHTLRACFATQLIRDSVAPAVVMKICGWRDLKTMQRYIRLAGIEVKGATQGLKLLPEQEAMGRVVSLFGPE